MGGQEPQRAKKHLCAGLLAHVDAGKTTLAESILYLSKTIKEPGRVDHKNAFLDTYDLEKQRGITIFSKQAEITLDDRLITLLDTPGHVDFSAEMERTLQVLDYAVLVINCMDGVQGHAITLWGLLKRYRIPAFIFINKMDQAGADKQKLMKELQAKFGDGCLDFNESDLEHLHESLALCDEAVMEKYLAAGVIEQKDIRSLIKKRKVIPCYFGSALRIEGVEELLEGLSRYTVCPDYPEEFGAKVYKIARDPQGNRLTYMKITGGQLKVKMPVADTDRANEAWEEKADQIRIYSGGQYRTVNEAGAGTICAAVGFSRTYAGEGLGIEKEAKQPFLEPVLTYRLELAADCDIHVMYTQLCQLAEEEPLLHIVWDQQADEIQAQVMGDVQIEILKSLILERFGTEVTFNAGNIVYKEKIKEPVVGVGHFEPLRHYAEVHLLLEPLAPGSGMQFESTCSEDMLDRNWQRLILTHLQERNHPGVLTGSDITDMKITVIAGRAHQKHTEGGDFRQATYRAVRQGLKKAESILLEPYYDFVLDIPADRVGRAMADIQRMSGAFEAPVMEAGRAIITGRAPVSTMRDYQIEVASYTRGEGRLACSFHGYDICHNAEQVIEAKGYDSERDPDNPTGSVFCSHGSGFVVGWDQVEAYMHVDSGLLTGAAPDSDQPEQAAAKPPAENSASYNDKELEEIFIRTYGPIKNHSFRAASASAGQKKEKPYVYKAKERVEEYLLVDGYNIIFAWNDLKELAKANITAARDKLCDILCNYQGYKKITVILVFDAYKTEGQQSVVQNYKNIHIVYTKKAETADQYIEKTVKKIARKHQVTVATSDALEQMIIWGLGAMRISANELEKEIASMRVEIRQEYLEQNTKIGNPLSVEAFIEKDDEE